ncbi:tetratricopeptide repeat protein [Streptomyces sp. NPDC020607]|uniref:tetratricopeptide repeat protein n=1 Tax=Streptomyces sp. NPDC020607 TaxID=3365082 RepID=UPI00379D2A3F
MDVRRIVEIWNPGAKLSGTGFLVADRIVLTALHNVLGEGQPEVRRLDPAARDDRWAAAELLWPGLAQDPQVDVALIRVTDGAWTAPDGMDPIRWGRIEGAVVEERLGCLAVGFPRSEERGGVRDTKEIRGYVESLTGLKSGGERITVHVNESAVPSKPDGKSRWKGTSGAALFARGRLVGVVTTDRARDYEADQLTAVSVASLAARPGFAMAVKAAGGDLVLEGVSVASDTGLPRTAYDVEVPRGIHNLPDLPSRIFVGRDEALATLSRALSEDSQTITQTLHGLGGVGKTTLALHYAHDHRDEYRLVWWIRADTPELIDTGLAALAARLRGDRAPVLATAQAATWAIGWLQVHPGWLLVFDNVERPEDVRPVTGQLRDTGRQLITSRCKGGWSGDPLPLSVLATEDSLDLLARLTDAGDEEEARALAEDLGHLPLALEQAGAFMAQTLMTAGEYREMLGRYPGEATDAAPEGADPARTMARIWRITLDALHARDPRAVDLLRIAAWYAPTDIPRDLYAPLAKNPVDLARLLALLANYNMITLDRSTFGVHRLVQTVARTVAEDDPHRTDALIAGARQQAAVRLCEECPRDPVDNVTGWPKWRELQPHAEALLAAWPPVEDTENTHFVLNQMALYLQGQGELRKAIDYFRRGVETAERLLGTDHPGTLTALNNLAGVYGLVGDVAREIHMYEHVLDARMRVLGPDHPDTLLSRNNVASASETMGDVARAISLYEETLAVRLRVLGADHPDTLMSRHNLAFAYKTSGDAARALSLYEKVLADRLRVLGRDHPDTMLSRNNIAGVYMERGEVGRAISMYEELLGDQARVLGTLHPNTLMTRNNVAGAHEAAGDVARALSLYEDVLADLLRVLGADHPHTLATRHNMAYAYEKAGDAAVAITLFDQVLADQKRVLGDYHPDVLKTRSNLAHAYRATGDVDSAVNMYEQVLDDSIRALSPDHPTTRLVRSNLAVVRRYQALARATHWKPAKATD